MKGYETWKDDLGRWCVHCEDSSYSRGSDHRVYGLKAEAEKAAKRHKETGQWE